jgi:uncharacterized membrane protein
VERGPVQVVVVGFTDEQFAGEVLPELRRLRGGSVVRLLDVTLVRKDEAGILMTVDFPDVEWSEFGEIVCALMGFGPHYEEGLLVGPDAGAADGARGSDAGEAWAISDAIPAASSAAVVLMEHLWAIPLRGAIVRGGGFALEDTWLHPADLIAVGAVPSEEIAPAE